ncbi:hypothetical protein U0070_004116, partial [Myodes glareolus]
GQGKFQDLDDVMGSSRRQISLCGPSALRLLATQLFIHSTAGEGPHLLFPGLTTHAAPRKAASLLGRPPDGKLPATSGFLLFRTDEELHYGELIRPVQKRASVLSQAPLEMQQGFLAHPGCHSNSSLSHNELHHLN